MITLTCIVLAILWVIQRPQMRYAWLTLITFGALVPIIRLEAVAYIIIGAISLAIFSRRSRFGILLITGVVVAACLVTGARWALFDAVLPNTIQAKLQVPYRVDPLTGIVFFHLFVGVCKELLYVLLPALFLMSLVVIRRRDSIVASVKSGVLAIHARRVDPVVAFGCGYVAGVGVLNLAIGPVYGYWGRMEQSAGAVAVIVVAVCFADELSNAANRKWIACAAVVLLAISLRTFMTEFRNGVGYEGATPANNRATGEAVNSIRLMLHRPNLSFLTSDVGGSSLCCEDLRILDLGLLASKELAAKGYRALPGYVITHKPDVIWIITDWAESSRIKDIEYFRDNYRPVVINDTWLFLRSDLLAELEPRCVRIPIAATADMDNPDDESYVRYFGIREVCHLR